MLSRLLCIYVAYVASHTSNVSHASAVAARLLPDNSSLSYGLKSYFNANLVRFNTVQSPLMLLNNV